MFAEVLTEKSNTAVGENFCEHSKDIYLKKEKKKEKKIWAIKSNPATGDSLEDRVSSRHKRKEKKQSIKSLLFYKFPCRS